jgi:hypothetical protein
MDALVKHPPSAEDVRVSTKHDGQRPSAIGKTSP